MIEIALVIVIVYQGIIHQMERKYYRSKIDVLSNLEEVEGNISDYGIDYDTVEQPNPYPQMEQEIEVEQEEQESYEEYKNNRAFEVD